MPELSAPQTFIAINNSRSQASLPELLSAANSIEDDSCSEMEVEHESVGRKLIYNGDILNADDTKILNKAIFNHHKNESKGVFFKRQTPKLLFSEKGHCSKSQNTDQVIPYPR